MRVTIWQQFSSNHSSFFTVVGEFQSPEAAQQATNELRRIIQSVVDWYAAHPKHAEKWLDDYWPPTPAEHKIASQYGVQLDKQYGMDWISADTDVQSVVMVVDRLVFLTHPGDTWNGGHPFDWIMEKLGGKAFVNGDRDVGPYHKEPSARVLITFVCNAPDPTTAQDIAETLTISSEINYDLPTSRFEKEDIAISGTQLRFTKWYYRFHHVDYDLSGLLAYLTSKGCTNIEYRVGYEDADSNEAESL